MWWRKHKAVTDSMVIEVKIELPYLVIWIIFELWMIDLNDLRIKDYRIECGIIMNFG